jgi:formyltetrahydrofolate-dependent phosphoribosylglycinamide formyltransferase
MTLSLVVLASGRGSNLQAILSAIEAGTCAARVSALITDNPQAGAIAIAKAHHISVHIIDRALFSSSISHDEKILSLLDTLQPDLVLLAGYMRLIRSPNLLSSYAGRILNIHPSLLPKYPGAHAQKDAFDALVAWRATREAFWPRGTKASEEALIAAHRNHRPSGRWCPETSGLEGGLAGGASGASIAGEKFFSGLTIHLVDASLDGGPILYQEKVDISDCHSSDEVAARILAREHAAYPLVLQKIATGKLKVG